jgi:hypothetical protein
MKKYADKQILTNWLFLNGKNFETSDYMVSVRKQITQYKYCIKSFIFPILKKYN